MILVLLGTNPYPFDRLLKAIDNWADKSGEKVIAQVGHTNFPSTHIECHDFVSHCQIIDWLDQSEIVISQGGFGSLRDCLRSRKPTIAVPRLPELGESQDSQIELVEALASEGLVLHIKDVNELSVAIEKVKALTPPVLSESELPNIVASKVEEFLGAE